MVKSESSRPAVLVTGGAGYIGSHACKALSRCGYRPIALDNLTLGHRWAVKWGPLEVIDLLDTVAVASAMRRHTVSAVVHFAASAYVGDSIRDPAAYYRNNVLSTMSLLDAMRLSGVRDLVFSSSCAVYGTPSKNPIDESHDTRPISPYGQTKLDCENLIRWYSEAYGLRSIALRYFNAAGADKEGDLGEDHDPETRLIPRAIFAAIHESEHLDVFGTDYPTDDGTAVRDYVHVTDLAMAHVAALRCVGTEAAFEAINLGTGRGISVSEIVEAVQQIASRPVKVRYAPRRAGDPPVVIADANRAWARLRWKPMDSSVHDIVSSALAWHVRHIGSRAGLPASGM